MLMMNNEAEGSLGSAGISQSLNLEVVHDIWKENNINFLVLLFTQTIHEKRRGH